MNNFTAGKSYSYNGVTITPLQPVLEDKADEIMEIQKRKNYVVITFPESVQRRWEAQIFQRLPIKPTLSPFRFRGKLCVFLNSTTLYNQDKELVANIEDGFYHGKLFFQFPSINEKDGETCLKIKLLSIILMNKTCPW